MDCGRRAPSIGYQILAYALLTAAEVLVSITCLEFSYTQAPRKMKSIIMAVFLFSISAGNLITTIVNKRLPGLNGANYYLFFAALMAATAIVYVIVAMFYRERTYIQSEG